MIPGYSDESIREAEFTPMVTTAMTLAVLPFLTPRMQKVVTFVNVGSTLVKGADVLIKEGIKMEVLDALAVGLAAADGEVYTANITDLLLSLGEFLERRTERQSDRLLRRLLRPEPAMAWVERDGELVQINGDEVCKGEIVTVGVGETVPVDGRVVDGVALVNQAAVTGEDVPVLREAPKRVIAGSVLEEGQIRVEAVQVGADTTTARVSRFIQESLSKRSDTQRLAEELADKRVYLTLGTGGIVYALTPDLTQLQSVFLVDYSCALKLGTPVAFKSGIYRAAEHGVLMKGGEAIEHLAEIDTLVFDKTGTLTHSELIVTDVLVLARDDGCTEEGLLALVASVEEHARHPVAEAVVEAAKEWDLQHISHGALMDDRLSAVADAREIAAKTMGLIRGNFKAAVGINTAILGGAISGWLSPVASALLHNGTTIGILLNALKGVRLSGGGDQPLAR
ncbi:HAD-IC family P-type ATPase [Candidatus Thiosymbion oneisti]|uniref:HAD-IC family P-type ATPase n=1 Tax=Candidatus Thiosymbion oneisti TaxID=589554 RepID=UPI000ABDCB48|nr:HAD-IC family P-type ATPase [Candidatus Thiosymbion oneisti]